MKHKSRQLYCNYVQMNPNYMQKKREEKKEEKYKKKILSSMYANLTK